MRRGMLVLLAACTGGLAAAAPAAALPDCTPDQPAAKRIVSGRGTLESVIVDRKGRLFFTDAGVKGLVRIDAPGGTQTVLGAGQIDAGGGIVLDDDGTLLVGFGTSIPNGLTGRLQPRSGIVRVDPDSGAVTPYVTGTQMSNGLARVPTGGFFPQGTIFASNDVTGGIDRVAPGGAGVQMEWSPVASPNGLAIDSTGQYLFAAQTFQEAQISRVEIANPSRIVVYARPGLEDVSAGLDGLTIDGRDRLFVAANLPGEAWRVDPGPSPRKLCVVARGLGRASALALGQGSTGFVAGRLYVVNFGGEVYEIAGVTEPAVSPPPIDDVAPKLTMLRIAGHRVRFGLDERARVVVTIARRTCSRTRCRFAPTRRLTFTAAPGPRTLLLNRGHRARPGRYRVTVVATDAVGNTATAAREATVARRR